MTDLLKKQQQKDVLLDNTGVILTKNSKKLPLGYHVGRRGYLEQDEDDENRTEMENTSNGSSNGGSNGNGGGGNGSNGGGNGG